MSNSTHLQDQQHTSNNEHRKESFIEKSLHRKLSEQTQDGAFEQILNLEYNKTCADCPAKGPRWVSIDYGVFICMNCAGAHRMLGRQNTRVRSVKLDSWTNELIQILQNTGNKISNDYFEFKLPKNFKKPGLNSSMQEIQKFINDKYINKKFSPDGYPNPVQEYMEKLQSGDFKSGELKSGEFKPKIEENKKIPPLSIKEEDDVFKKDKSQAQNNNWTKFYDPKNVQKNQQTDDLLNIDSHQISQSNQKQAQEEEDLFENFQTANTINNTQQISQQQQHNTINQNVNYTDQFTEFVSNQPQIQQQSQQFSQFQQSSLQNNQQQQQQQSQVNLSNLYSQNNQYNTQQVKQQSPQINNLTAQNQQSNYSALDSLSFNTNQLQQQQQQQQQMMMLMRQQQEMMMRQNQLQFQQMGMGYGNQNYNSQQFMKGGMTTGGYNNMYPQQQFQMNNQFNTQNNQKI